jgi:hypothetical protein
MAWMVPNIRSCMVAASWTVSVGQPQWRRQ